MAQKRVPATPEQIARWGHIAAAVRSAMDAKSLTSAAFNELAGLKRDDTHIYQVRNAKLPPSGRVLTGIRKVLGLPMADLIERPATKALVAKGRPKMVPTAPTIPRPQDVLSFAIDANGDARLRLDFTAPAITVVPILRMLLDIGLVMKGDHNELSNPPT